MSSIISLGSAENYAVLSSNKVANIGPSMIRGNVGVYPGNVIEGFPPGTLTNGLLHIGDDSVKKAHIDLLLAYNDGKSRHPADFTDDIDKPLGGQIFCPGLYKFGMSALLNGKLVLDGYNYNENSVWIFQVGSSLKIDKNSTVALINGAKETNVFWIINGSADIGDNSTFNGTIIAHDSITIGLDTTINGHLLSVNGNVNLNNCHVNSCHEKVTTNNHPNINYLEQWPIVGYDPHIICLDGSRIDLYEPGFYRLFDNYSSVNDDKIIINAEVQRESTNHFDYFNQLWIKIMANNNQFEYLLNLTPKGISVNGSTQLIPKWEHKYTTRNQIRYDLVCDSSNKTIRLNLSKNKDISRYGGAMVGQIFALKQLKDIKPVASRPVELGYYNQIGTITRVYFQTIQKKILQAKNDWFRLLQWKNDHSCGAINIRLDKDGQVRQLTIFSSQDGKAYTDSWAWIGNEHWKLLTLRQNRATNRRYVHENHFSLGNDMAVLLRLQASGSISVALRNVKSTVRGLFFGDVINVYGANDFHLYEIFNPISHDFFAPETGLLYHKEK